MTDDFISRIVRLVQALEEKKKALEYGAASPEIIKEIEKVEHQIKVWQGVAGKSVERKYSYKKAESKKEIAKEEVRAKPKEKVKKTF